jgi:acetolactate synthase small subunit
MAEAGALGDVSGLDLNDEGALTRLCVSFYQRELILTGVAVETDEYASLSVLDCITYEGDNSVENMDVYYGVIEDGVWYLT